MSGPLARLPRALPVLGGAFLLLVSLVAIGLLRPLDRLVAAHLWQDVPCWGRLLGQRADVLFAAELSLIYALVLGAICVRARRPVAGGWILLLLLAGVGVEITFKYYFSQPAPSDYLNALTRPSCGTTGPSYPFTVVPTPSTLPSGYSIRAAYFSLLLAAVVSARWPALHRPAWLALGSLSILAAASRVTVGWHWPTDALAGWLLGAGSAVLVIAQADGFRWLRGGGTTGARATGARGSGRSGASGRRASGTRRPARQPRR